MNILTNDPNEEILVYDRNGDNIISMGIKYLPIYGFRYNVLTGYEERYIKNYRPLFNITPLSFEIMLHHIAEYLSDNDIISINISNGDVTSLHPSEKLPGIVITSKSGCKLNVSMNGDVNLLAFHLLHRIIFARYTESLNAELFKPENKNINFVYIDKNKNSYSNIPKLNTLEITFYKENNYNNENTINIISAKLENDKNTSRLEFMKVEQTNTDKENVVVIKALDTTFSFIDVSSDMVEDLHNFVLEYNQNLGNVRKRKEE